MATENPDFIPVLIGGDMNCYSVARAIHEEYGVKSYAFGRFPAGDTMHSRIVECFYDEPYGQARSGVGEGEGFCRSAPR